MQTVSCGRLLWIYSVLFTSLQLWGQLEGSGSPVTLPAPKLAISSWSRDSMVLVCQASEGNTGVVFMLYKIREKVDSVELQPASDRALFTVGVSEGTERKLFCCLYMNQEGQYSAFSPYLNLEQWRDAPPTHSTPSFPPPVLSVDPSSGVVKLGDTLSFSCSVPTLPQPQSVSPYEPASFFLLRRPGGSEPTSMVLHPEVTQRWNPEARPGIFTVGPVRGDEDGEYTCLYQIPGPKGFINSTVSNVIQISVQDVLPRPTLVLQQNSEVWHLLCSGSPSYPGAVFFLYLAGNDQPVASHAVNMNSHKATFQLPVQDALLASYQCHYSVRLGTKWTNSQRSPSLAVSKGVTPPPEPEESIVDWPLVLGSLSAVVLFLCSLALVVVVVHRRVKAGVEKKKKRQEAKFWMKDGTKGHGVDIRLSCSSFTSQEWASRETEESASRSALWNSHSTFITPIH